MSGATVSPSYTGQIIKAWYDDQIEIAVSDPTLRELRKVLDYPYAERRYHWTAEQKDAFVADVRLGAELTATVPEVDVCKDEDDNMWFACAEAAKAHYIVSKDEDILDVGEYKGIKTVKPGYFVWQVLPSLGKEAA
ncbi:MAG: putative toxin-antitoxin system toxin component, PIN family [Aggregatilineales bacterium]